MCSQSCVQGPPHVLACPDQKCTIVKMCTKCSADVAHVLLHPRCELHRFETELTERWLLHTLPWSEHTCEKNSCSVQAISWYRGDRLLLMPTVTLHHTITAESTPAATATPCSTGGCACTVHDHCICCSADFRASRMNSLHACTAVSS